MSDSVSQRPDGPQYPQEPRRDPSGAAESAQSAGAYPRYPQAPQVSPGSSAQGYQGQLYRDQGAPAQQSYGHYPQQDYPPQGYGAPGGYYAPAQAYERPGSSHETSGMVLGIIGLVCVLIFIPASAVLGSFAIWQGNKASRLGANGSPGQIMGWISLVLGLLGILIPLGLILFFFVIAASAAAIV